LPILLFFIAQYFGLTRIAVLVEKSRELLASASRILTEGLPDNSLPLLEGA
jgi:hypothetical protein